MFKHKLIFALLLFSNAFAATNINIIIFENNNSREFVDNEKQSSIAFRPYRFDSRVSSFDMYGVRGSSSMRHNAVITTPKLLDVIKKIEKNHKILHTQRLVLNGKESLNLEYEYKNDLSLIKIAGKIYVNKTNFYDCFFNLNIEKQNYKLKMQQKVRSKKQQLTYIDHPFIGIITYIE
jgi:predicted DNA-binding protein YlxM (UPF0122 family)